MTQEFLAQMLGVRRTTVAIAARLLQSTGMISYRRGHIHIVNRVGIEKLACKCYAALPHSADTGEATEVSRNATELRRAGKRLKLC